MANSKKLKSGFHGVFQSSPGRWSAKVYSQGERMILGIYNDPVTAARVYDTYLVHLIMVGDRKEEDCLFNFPQNYVWKTRAEKELLRRPKRLPVENLVADAREFHDIVYKVSGRKQKALAA